MLVFKGGYSIIVPTCGFHLRVAFNVCLIVPKDHQNKAKHTQCMNIVQLIDKWEFLIIMYNYMQNIQLMYKYMHNVQLYASTNGRLLSS